MRTFSFYDVLNFLSIDCTTFLLMLCRKFRMYVYTKLGQVHEN